MNALIAGNAHGELDRVLDRPSPLVNSVPRGDARLTEPWGHSALHVHSTAMSGHVLINYHDESSESARHVAGERIGSTPRSAATTSIPRGHDQRWGIVGPVQISHASEKRLQERVDPSCRERRGELFDRAGIENPVAARLMEMLSGQAERGEPVTKLFVEQAADLLRTQLLEMPSSSNARAAEPTRRGLANWQVKKVTVYMRERLDEEVSLNELASLVGLSRFHFCTAFRRATGHTPHEWLVAQRMEEARKLLADPALRITEIAFAVGYETPSSFAASFRKTVGVTPTEFRRQL